MKRDRHDLEALDGRIGLVRIQFYSNRLGVDTE